MFVRKLHGFTQIENIQVGGGKGERGRTDRHDQYGSVAWKGGRLEGCNGDADDADRADFPDL